MVSIITPCYNSEKFIEKTIQSVMNQDCRDFEHIIVDGGSKDNTVEIIKKYDGKYNMRWITEPDKGMYDAIRKGFMMAQGDVVCWINSDDTYMPWAVSTMKKVMSENPDVMWCTGLPSAQDENGIPFIKSAIVPTYNQKMILRGWHHGRALGFIQQESTFWKRSLLDSVDLNKFAEYTAAGDYYLWKNFAQKAKLYSVDAMIGCFRVHNGQISGEIAGYFEEIKSDYSVLKLFGWTLTKIFHIERLYYLMNRKNLIHVGPVPSSLKKRIENTISISKRLKRGNRG